MNTTKAILVSFIIAIILILVITLIEMLLNPPAAIVSATSSVPIMVPYGPKC